MDNFRFPHSVVPKLKEAIFGAVPSGPTGFAPADIRHLYGFDLVAADGTGETIAIIIPGGNDFGNVQTDLAFFDSFFSIPAPPSFTKVDQNGGQNFPASNTSAYLEMALDVQWAHAIAPGAKIVVVVCTTTGINDALAGIRQAALQGATVINMSFGYSEFGNEAGLAGDVSLPNGIAMVAASGDTGTVTWPAISPKVLAVGGTLVTADGSGNWSSETGWINSGGGISAFESQPTYQNTIVTQSATKRCNPDVALPGGQGYSVRNTDPAFGGWVGVQGTSAGSPQWAALIALANQVRVAGGKNRLNGFWQLLPLLYSMSSTNFHDITTGGAAAAGYDLATGLGTPKVNLVVPALNANVSAAAVRILNAGINNTVLNNVLFGGNGISLRISNDSITGLVSNFNIGQSATFFQLDDTSAISTLAAWHTAHGQDANSVGTTPLLTFLDPGSSNYVPKNPGPAISAGTNTDAPATDIIGEPRVLGHIDIGAWAPQILTSIVLYPTALTLGPGNQQAFTAYPLDQFGNLMSPIPTYTFSVLSGGGSIASNGVYTAPASGSATVKVAVGSIIATSAVTIAPLLPQGINFSGGIITIEGTQYNEAVTISNVSGPGIGVNLISKDSSGNVVFNQTLIFSASSVTGIHLYGNAGSVVNNFVNNTSVPLLAYGGSGGGIIQGGAGVDYIQAGLAGIWTIKAISGNDTLVGGPGTNFIYGGSGNSTIIPGLGTNNIFPHGA